MTGPQEGFLRSLAQQPSAKRIDVETVDYLKTHSLAIGQASMMIEACLYLLNQLPPPPDGKRAMVKEPDIDEAVTENVFQSDTTHKIYMGCIFPDWGISSGIHTIRIREAHVHFYNVLGFPFPIFS